MSEKFCRKCGGNMLGPSYCSGSLYMCQHYWDLSPGHHTDHLVFSCQTCGFQDCEPTLQEKKAANRAGAETPERFTMTSPSYADLLTALKELPLQGIKCAVHPTIRCSDRIAYQYACTHRDGRWVNCENCLLYKQLTAALAHAEGIEAEAK